MLRQRTFRWLRAGGSATEAFPHPLRVLVILLVAVVARNVFRFDWALVRWLVVLVTAADLFAAGYAFNTRMENDYLFPANNTIRYLLNDPEPYRVAVISENPLYHPNILSYYHLPVVEGYLTVLPVDYVRYVKTLFSEAHVTRNGILFLFEPNVQALRLLNVKYVLSDLPLEREYEGLERVLDSNNHAVYRIRDHLPRVFCASDVFYDDRPVREYEDLLEEFDEPLVLAGGKDDERFPEPCRVADLQVYTHGLSADIEADQSRYLVIPYPFSEHWAIRINGESAEPRKANGYHMAVRIPAGTSTVEVRYRNRLIQLSAWILVLASLALLLYVRRRRAGLGVLRIALGATALLVIYKSSLSLPLIRNDHIPEREPVAEQLEVMQQGTIRGERELLSDRIFQGSPVELPLHVDSKGLTGLSLLAGTFQQPRLEQTISVQIRDEQGGVLVERQIEGRKIANNSWFTLRFPPIEKDTRLSVRISSQDERIDRSFVLWLERDGRVCVQSFYRLGTQARALP